MKTINWKDIDTSKLKTKSGLPVRIYATDGETGQGSVHGAVKTDKGWMIRVWNLGGQSIDGIICPSDLDTSDAQKPWRPERDSYYYIGSDLKVIAVNGLDEFTQTLLATGNCFRTREEAEAKASVLPDLGNYILD